MDERYLCNWRTCGPHQSLSEASTAGKSAYSKCCRCAGEVSRLCFASLAAVGHCYCGEDHKHHPLRQTDRETDTETERGGRRERKRQTDRQTDRDRDSETERQRERRRSVISTARYLTDKSEYYP